MRVRETFFVDWVQEGVADVCGKCATGPCSLVEAV